MPDFDPNALDKLQPEARARVEAALSKTLEAELANEALVENAGKFSRSRGAIFSRSKTGRVALDSIVDPANADLEIVNRVEAMDEKSFAEFANRLSTLRSISRE